MLFRCHDISKRFGGIQALDGVDLEIDADEIVGLIGPNGAGKTTLFNVITGIHTPNSGSVTFDGKEIVGWPTHRICRAGIARSFQTPKPIDSLSIEENVRVADHFGRNDREPVFSLDELCQMFGLASKREEPPEQLQLVEKKRLDLARALATAPKLVFLDEIMAGLMPTEKDDIVGQIKRLHDEHGFAFLVIEHDLRVVRDLCDRLVVINEGRNIASGSASTVFEDDRVKETYIGSSA